MAGKSKEPEKATEPVAPKTSVKPSAIEEKVPTYRADMGEGLPPQAPPAKASE